MKYIQLHTVKKESKAAHANETLGKELMKRREEINKQENNEDRHKYKKKDKKLVWAFSSERMNCNAKHLF
jgi:hypothetical protein